MKERISIFNYEAYYLDYLEGNLGKEDTRLLLDFLADHPECEIDMDEIPMLEPEKGKSSWNDLKVFNDSDQINHNNIEYFIIAKSEGLLSSKKSEELQSFLDKNPAYVELMDGYLLSKLIPEKRLVFTDKHELKRNKTLVLWPYYVAAVAAVIFVLLYFNIPTASIDQPSGAPISNNKPNTNKEAIKPDPVEQSFPEFLAENEQITLTTTPAKSKDTTILFLDNSNINPRNIRNVLSADYNRSLEPLADLYLNETPIDNENVLAVNSFNEMSNPIEPITQFITNKTNVEIDYKQRKKTTKKKGGFFLKIGKFEISRNVH